MRLDDPVTRKRPQVFVESDLDAGDQSTTANKKRRGETITEEDSADEDNLSLAESDTDDEPEFQSVFTDSDEPGESENSVAEILDGQIHRTNEPNVQNSQRDSQYSTQELLGLGLVHSHSKI